MPKTDIHVQLTGEDGNVYSVIGRVSKALRRGGRSDLVDEFQKEASSGDYDHALQTCFKYVEVD